MPCAIALCLQLTGIVLDPTGAALAGVPISVAGPGFPQQSVTADNQGRFSFSLPPARYTVTAAYPGFETATQTVVLETAPLTITIVLAVAGWSDTVTVSGTRTGDADVQSTPAAVTVLTSRSLEQLGARSLEQLASVVPTLVTSQQAGLGLVAIRGISTNVTFPGSDPSVAINVDGVYLARASMVFTDFFDVDRVEVLRGPQGTLYGRNAVGGAVHMITRAPTSTFEASARVAGGDFHLGRVEAVVNGPLAGDRVSGRLAILRSTRHGYVNAIGTPGQRLGGDDTWAARGQLLFDVFARATLLVSADYARDDGVPLTWSKPIAALPGPAFDQSGDLWTVRVSDLASGHNLQRGAHVKLTVPLRNGTVIKSLTAYRTSDFRFFVDADDTELRLLTVETPDRQRQWSQEVTVARRTAQQAWVAGAYFFGEHDEGDLKISVYAQGIQIRPFPRARTNAAAVFGESTFNISGRVSLTGGLRFSRDRKDFVGEGGTYRLNSTQLAVPASYYRFDDHITDGVWTPKVALQIRAAPSAFAYVSAARGFKSGGFNLTSPEPGRGYHPEYAWSYEAGIKSTLAGGASRINAAFFYNDYSDLQVLSAIRLGVVDITNAASAVTKGLELEGSTRVKRLTMSVTGSWLDARYRRYLASSAAGPTDVSGRRLNYAPEWSGGASALYEQFAGNLGTVYVRGDTAWQTRVFFTPFNTARETQGPVGLVHMRAGFASRSGHWNAAFYMRNLMHQPMILGTAAVSPVAIGGRPGEPRNWGVEFTIGR